MFRKVNKRRKPQNKAKRNEHNDQSDVIKWLSERGLLYFAVPNSQKTVRSMNKIQQIRYWQMMKREGFKKGAPDILIFNSPIDLSYTEDESPAVKLKPAGKGIALEMKTLTTKTLEAHKICTCMEPEQVQWKKDLEGEGWVHILAHGSEDAINQISKYYPEFLDIG